MVRELRRIEITDFVDYQSVKDLLSGGRGLGTMKNIDDLLFESETVAVVKGRIDSRGAFENNIKELSEKYDDREYLYFYLELIEYNEKI